MATYVRSRTLETMAKAGEGDPPAFVSRGLIQDRSNIVCLVVSDVTTPFRARMLEILTSRLQAIDTLRQTYLLATQP